MVKGEIYARRALHFGEQSSNVDMLMSLFSSLKKTGDERICDCDEDNDSDNNNDALLLVILNIEYCLNEFFNVRKNVKSKVKVNLTQDQAILGIETLTFQYEKMLQTTKSSTLESKKMKSILKSLLLLLKNEASKLPPEKTARDVVGRIFIPCLSSLNKNDQMSSAGQITFISDALVTLLQNPNHASAMLAPLVHDVYIMSNYGKEEQTVNPLQIRLQSVVLKSLNVAKKQGRLKDQICLCQILSASIDAIRKLNKGNQSYIRVDFRILQEINSYILESLIDDKGSFRHNTVASLQLLKSLVSCYPNEMIGMGSKLITESLNYPTLGKTVSSNDHTKHRDTIHIHLPSMIIIENSDNRVSVSHKNAKFVALVADCLVDFIFILPWNMWVKQSSSSNHEKKINNVTEPFITRQRNTSGLYKNTVNALEALISVAMNAFNYHFDQTILNSLGRLIKAVLTEIPYCDMRLLIAGEKMWTFLCNAAFDLNELCFNREKKKISYDILVAAMGGKVTPQGQLLEMCTSGRSWFLNKNSSDSFIKLLVDSCETMDERSGCSTKMLSSILRTLPDVAIQRWDSFRNLFEDLNTCKSKKNDIIRLDLLENFMLGRRDFPVSTESMAQNDKIIIDICQVMLRSWSQNSLGRLLTIYSTFRSQDWIELDRVDGLVLRHFETILEHCHNPNGKIREGASKAIGEFSTQYIAQNNVKDSLFEEIKIIHYSLMSKKMCTTMLEMCGDTNAAVRSMAIFSLGNLASALKHSNRKDTLSHQSVHNVSKVILASFNDKNNKVVKNSIRSIGIYGNLLVCCLLDYPENFVFSSYEILSKIVESLTLKLGNALRSALREKALKLTWKERSAAKKHGWGACYSLGLVFEGLSVEMFTNKYNDLVLSCSEAIRYLVLCSKNYKNLNEKIVLASMIALCKLSNNLLTLNDYDGGYTGDALISCILLHHNLKEHNVTVSSKLVTQNENLLRHLLHSASLKTAIKVLNDEYITTNIMESMYLWMVDQPLPSSAFEIFANAFQQGKSWSDVSIEQRFASRAVQKYKQARLSDTISVLMDSNEGDEL